MANSVITGLDDKTIGATMQAGATLDGLWFAGKAGTNGKVQSVQVSDGCTVRNCVFINMPEAISHGADNVTIDNCIFIGCGWDRFSHSVYFSQSVAPKGSTLQDCIFIGGQAYHIHLWHNPANITIQRNFSAGSEWAIVCHGDGHVIQDNFIWSGHGKPGQEKLTWFFAGGKYQYINNYAGEDVIDPGAVPDGVRDNTFFGSFTFGANPTVGQLDAGIKAQIDEAVKALGAAASLTAEELVTDTSIATNAAIIRDSMKQIIIMRLRMW